MIARSATLVRGDAATAGVAAPGDRRFRRPDIRPGGRRPASWWAWRAASFFAAVCVLGVSAYAATRYAASSRLVRVRHITVTGNTRLSSGEIEALVQGLRGQNIFEVNLDQYRQRLAESPWVSSANMRRVLPDSIEVHLTERNPMAIARVDGRLYLVDEEGVVIDEYGPEYREYDLPVVDGLVRSGDHAGAVADSERAGVARAFLAAIGGVPVLRQRVSQFDVSDPRDVVALLDDDPTIVHVGDSRFAERLRTYLDLAPTLQDRLSEIDYVDMRFDERVYVKSKPTAASKAKAAADSKAGVRR